MFELCDDVVNLIVIFLKMANNASLAPHKYVPSKLVLMVQILHRLLKRSAK